MAASDTVVGIVGSILLVGVMVGVFVYEYNNVPPLDDDEETPPVEHVMGTSFSGTLSPAGQTTASHQMTPDTGFTTTSGSGTWSPTLTGGLSWSVTDPNGNEVGSGSAGGASSFVFSFGGPDGAYTLTVSMTGVGGLGGSYDFDIEYEYESHGEA